MNNLIVIEWDDAEHTAVRMTIHEGWTWQDLYTRNLEIVEMMRSTDAPVHLIIDCAFKTIPIEGVITHARNILGAYPPNCDMRLIVSRSMLVERLVRIFQTTFRTALGRHVHLVPTLDAARAAIRARRQANAS